MDLKRLTARVAAHADAITAAKQAGMTWKEIATVFEIPNGESARKASDRARRGIREGRIVPLAQLPLPIPAAPKPIASVSVPPQAPELPNQDDFINKHLIK